MKTILKSIVSIVAVCAALAAMIYFAVNGNTELHADSAKPAEYMVMNRYDRYMNNTFSDALQGVMSIKKTYWLSDNDPIAPKPNQSCYGEVTDPKDMLPIIEMASELLEGQQLSFSTDVEIQPGSVIRYYYDPTILAITWKVVQDNSVYVISEVKIAHASQFRRFLSDGEFGSGARYYTAEMAKTVNAVVASAGDYYAVRKYGTVVYNGEVMRMEGAVMDGCHINDKGDLLPVRAGELTTLQEMEQFIVDNNVRFSLAFGPILIENGEVVPFRIPYCVGELETPNVRSALCQTDSLHYLIVVNSMEAPNNNGLLMVRFAQRLKELGAKTAYNLDGGRSATLIINNEQINHVNQRELSDIIYFATAIANGE